MDYLRAGRSSSRPPRRAIGERLDKKARKLLTAQTIARFRSVRNGRLRAVGHSDGIIDRAMPIGPRSTRVLPAVNTTGTLRQAGLLVGAMLVAGIVSAFVLKQDVNWDLQNYHFYNAWAFVHQRLGWDIAPAQLQTYLNPLLDLPFYAMVAADWPPRLISFVMGLPAGIGAFFLAKIVLVLFENMPRKERWLYAAIAFLIGITGSAAVSQLGTTLNEWQGAALVMIALWLVLRRVAQGATGWRTLVAAGLLCGMASGLKLTTATYAVGLCAALLLQRPVLWLGVRQAFAFGIAVLVGVALMDGPWMWTLYTHFGNPLFPFFNDVFHSPWWDQAAFFDRRFGPHTWSGWLRFPFRFFGYSSLFVTELRFRDWRLGLLCVFAIGALVAESIRRVTKRDDFAPPPGPRPVWRVLAVFWCVSFVLWAAMYSIYRYLLPLELLSGALLVYLLRSCVPPRSLPTATVVVAAQATVRYPARRHRESSQHHFELKISPPQRLPTTTVVVAALAIFTVGYPDWWHREYAQHYFEVKVPPVAARAVVLLITGDPMAYVLPFFPPDGRFLGANNNFNDPERQNQLEAELAKVAREHDGPLYSLAFPAGAGPQVLRAHQLRRIDGGCTSIETNMLTSPIELCRLERSGGAGGAAPRSSLAPRAKG